MKIEVVSYQDLNQPLNALAHKHLEHALLTHGIVGISDVPSFKEKSLQYVAAAREFSRLPAEIKKQYIPDRDSGQIEGYELGAEWFKDQNNEWLIDDKKASYYANVPDHHLNIWPQEVDLKTPYLALGNLIFTTAKCILDSIGLNQSAGLHDHHLKGLGRMLHYHGESDHTHPNQFWCGAHCDHGLFTGLMPAYYFQHGKEIEEPEEAGLYVSIDGGQTYEKAIAQSNSVMLFQAGEFGQIVSNDRIRATKHYVKKAHHGIERHAFALFIPLDDNFTTQSTSMFINDPRYQNHQHPDGSISYGAWEKASYEGYRAVGVK